MSLEKIEKINDRLIKVLTIIYLNFLWIIFTLCGFVIFGIGPATYAVMKYYDRWLRLDDRLPITQTFFAYFKERYRQSMVISWIGLGSMVILIVNLFVVKEWYLQVANLLFLFGIVISFTYVYTIMAATIFASYLEIFKGAILLGFGYLHYTIIAWTLIISSYFVALKILPSIVFLFGIGYIGLIIGYAGKKILIEFTPKTSQKIINE
ncbi:DUF624 domain-containing protein [Melissococcus plutonius]|uniref:DUF624 domain-containing protein n=2 Tax=Melissococcus plutonius TaxID=33970 RepID=F3Y8X3_MELPT|nr:DUF624 domain-containing protein [Melissococcus plutonius]BAL62639.1 hypothetical protein MPD5_1435 [Melissococcus plutonius DAT561]AIM24576.1 hypothetical protein MEPL_c004170 [Melissococcus plutonius S1]KMT24659.1 hypothetical protein MEPL2_2c01630 [Melissococcus plutonius]KMT27372.1 hypothetical protein MEPL3_1c04450 [Melissococcus plutonius]KMT27545.1 hypothetical protein MEPL1_3c01560 [Melissococcus plutonius]